MSPACRPIRVDSCERPNISDTKDRSRTDGAGARGLDPARKRWAGPARQGPLPLRMSVVFRARHLHHGDEAVQLHELLQAHAPLVAGVVQPASGAAARGSGGGRMWRRGQGTAPVWRGGQHAVRGLTWQPQGRPPFPRIIQPAQQQHSCGICGAAWRRATGREGRLGRTS